MTPEEVAAIFARQRELDPRVIDLARALAAATRIEVELVRHVRLELFPESDAGLEANLWFSPLVAETDTLGLSFVPECCDELRRQLTLPEHRGTLGLARQVIDRWHRSDANQAGIPPVVSLHEAITYHALAGPASETPHEHRRLMQTSLGTLIKALDDDSDGSLTAWIARALPALPELARTSAAAIALAEKVRARNTSIVVENVPRADQQTAAAMPWVGTTIDVGCRRRTDGIEFSVPPATGSYVMKLPRTLPLVVEVQTPRFDGWQTRSIEFDPAPEHVVPDPSPGSRCRVTSAAGQRVSLQPSLDSAAPSLVIAGRDVLPGSTFTALRSAIADVGWTADSGGQAPGGGTARAVLLSAPRTAHDVTRLDTRLIKRLVNSGAPLLAWTARGLEPVRDVRQSATPIAGTKTTVLAVGSLGNVFANSGPSGIELWGEQLEGVPSSLLSRAVFSFSFRPDGRLMALVSDDELLRLWTPGEPEARALQGQRDRLTSVEFGRSGERLVSTSIDRSAAIWSMAPGTPQLHVWLRHEAAVNHAAFSPDEKMVATACEDGTVCIWDVGSGNKISTLRHDAAAHSVVWSARGDRLVVATGSEARVWALPALDPVSSLEHDRTLQSAVMSRDGRRVATLDIEGIARMWHVASAAQVLPALDPASGKNRRVPPLAEIYPRTPHGLTFGSDDRSLLVASSGRALLWNTLAPATALSSIKAFLLDSVGKLKALPPMQPEDVAALRRQLLAVDERTLQVWEGSAATADAPPVPAQAPDTRSPAPGGPERSRRAAVAIIDDGIDVLHRAFLDEDGRSRIVAIWDQRDTIGPAPEGFTYGRLHGAEDIAGYVRRQSVPEKLGRNVDGHGTHVASVAAGRRTGRFGGGVAPQAAIVAVIARQESASMLDALSFVDGVATRLQLPLAISLSADLQAGGRDGKSLFEVGVDAITDGGRKPGRVIVSPAGNRRGLRGHATVNVPSGAAVRLPWTVRAESAQVELWGSPDNSYRYRLTDGAGGRTEWINESRGDLKGIFENGVTFVMILTKRHIDNGDTQLFIQLEKLATISGWQLEIEAQDVSNSTPLQAWIHTRVGTCEFTEYVSDEMTLAVPATAATVIAVGAAASNRRTAAAAAQFSSYGPTRDGRQKPDVAAPGVDIDGARGGTVRDVIKMSGTSMAAAHVTGLIALQFEEVATTAATWPNAIQIAAALRRTTRENDGRWDPALGFGVVAARGFISALAR